MQIARERAPVVNQAQIALPSPELLREWCVGDVFAYLSRRLERKEDAEDLAIEVFLAAYSSPRQPLSHEAKPWLFGIARRKLADHLRKRRRVPIPLESEGAGELADEGGGGPDKSYLKKEALRTLRAIVETLPADQREALLLQHLEDFSIAEIAETLRKSPAAVNSLLQRARHSIFTRGKAYFLEAEQVNQ